MSFLDEYRSLERLAVAPQEIARRQIALLQEWVVQRPGEMFADLRAHEPVFVTPGPVVVSRYRDVIEVIDLHEIFSVKPYGVAMMRNNGGPNFILGMDDGPEFEQDLSILKLAVRRDDLERIGKIVAARTRETLTKLSGSRRIDITAIARMVPTLFVADYFGVPGPDPATLMNWVRAMFSDIFLNFTQDPVVAERGMKAGVEFRAYVDQLIANLKAGRAAGCCRDERRHRASDHDAACAGDGIQRQPPARQPDRLRDRCAGKHKHRDRQHHELHVRPSRRDGGRDGGCGTK